MKRAARSATPSPPSKRARADSNSETESEDSADSSSSTIKEEPDTEKEEATPHNALARFPNDDEDPVARRRNDLIACLPPSILTVPRAVKTIEIMLMSAEEALAEAAGSGTLKWIKKLIPQVEDDEYDAVLVAIKRGRIPALKLLLSKFGCRNTIEAATTAAGCGHLVILRQILHESRWYPIPIRHEASWKALSEAAANGHLPVVKFNMDQAKESVDWGVSVVYTPASRLSDALSRAISGGHRSVVKALLDPSRFHWNVSAAFEQALVDCQQGIADVIYQAFPNYVAEECGDLNQAWSDLFVQLARNGCVPGVKYLLLKKRASPDAIEEAFKEAAGAERAAVLEFLLKAKRISPEAFGIAFELAARSGSLPALQALYNTKRALPRTVNEAFKKVGSTATLKFLYDKEQIPADSVVDAFRSNTRYESSSDPVFIASEERIKMIQFLCNTGHVPSEMITAAFRAAATHGYVDVVKALRNDQNIFSEDITDAFSPASHDDHAAILKTLASHQFISADLMAKVFLGAVKERRAAAAECLRDEQLLSPKIIETAFENAADRGDIHMVESLFHEQRISPELTRTVFVNAARCGHAEVVEVLKNKSCISSQVITDAFVAAADSGRENVVKAVLDDSRLSSKVITYVFVKAANDGFTHIVQELYTAARISAEVGAEAFAKASDRGCIGVMKFLLYRCLTCLLRHEALVNASRTGCNEFVRFMVDNPVPREVLQKALNVSTDNEIQEILQDKLGALK